jgi:integrase/recombinase XerD
MNVPPTDPIARFLKAIWMERGLSPNTLVAYQADLTSLARWLAERQLLLMQTSRADLLEFLTWRVSSGARPNVTARQLSSFRCFFRYFTREGVIREDPTAEIAMPKIGRSLPKSITEEEVRALLAAPTASDPLGSRDRTMLEVLYATGLRVSELVNLRLCDMNLNQGSLRIIGKGNRERLVPLGEEAIHLLREFTREARAQILNNRQTDYVFPSRRGGPMVRQASPKISRRTPYAMPSPRTWSITAPICARCSCCSGIALCQPRRFTQTFRAEASKSYTRSIIRADRRFGLKGSKR